MCSAAGVHLVVLPLTAGLHPANTHYISRYYNYNLWLYYRLVVLVFAGVGGCGVGCWTPPAGLGL